MFRIADGEIAEALVWHLWQNHLPTHRPLRLTDGRQLRVLNTGRFNEDSGPDFLEALLTFGPGQPVTGDVEMHVRPADWRRHGHASDPRYNAVTLHVVMWNDEEDPTIIKQNGQYVPTLVLSDNLTDCFDRLQRRYENRSVEVVPSNTYPCVQLIHRASETFIHGILKKAGWERFMAKVRFMDARMERVSPEQTLYEGLMRAAGYSKNTDAFLELARKLPLALIREYTGKLPTGERMVTIQTLLFGVAGLLPSQSERVENAPPAYDPYVLDLETRWITLNSVLRIRPMPETSWQFFRLRPFNFPTIRLAGMSYLIAAATDVRFDVRFIQTVSEIASLSSTEGLKRLRKNLDGMLQQNEEDYWTTHTVLGGKTGNRRSLLIGVDRRREMMVNVILPFLYACTFRDGDLESQITLGALYERHPKLPANSLIRNMEEMLFEEKSDRKRLVDTALVQQGLLHIDELTCYKKDCTRCMLTVPSAQDDAL